MASGYWGFRPKLTQLSGSAWELLSGPNRATIGTTLGMSGSGSVTQSFAGTIWLYDDVLLTYTEYEISELPAGFQITVVSVYSGAASFDLPNIILSAGDAFDPDRPAVTSWTSNISGWDNTNPILATLNDLLQSNEITFNVSWNGVKDDNPFTISRVADAGAYPGFPIPPSDPNPLTAFTTFYLWGFWDDAGGVAPTPGGLTNVTVTPTGNPDEYVVDLTPGGDTTVIQLVTDNGDVIVLPVGDFPATVVLVGTEVEITPINTDPTVVSGPPTLVPLVPSYSYTMAGGINLGGSPTLQFIGNPSGIYTIVPGKTYDTLYERIPAVTSQDVKIPDPYIITAYVGE